ncbi:MAG: helix-hairpin-helix domain-containing protein [Lachnospiraceae bacterium]|nr:helix-hairpin-helix domain-containing protein [Lachnospiraceae bacterium]
MTKKNYKNNLAKTGILLMFPLFMLTACTGKEEIILVQDAQKEEWETGAVLDRKSASGTAPILSEEDGMSEPETKAETVKEDRQTEIYVHICGAVVNPGVYVLEAGSRIFEGIEAAGGFREDACEDYVNQAKPLQDGQRLVIPTVEEMETAKENGIYQDLWIADADGLGETIGENAASLANTGGLININTATESELSGINGIGPSKAAAVVAYRQENGRFTSVEEIMKVSGIGEGTYEKIKDKISVN